ncbi:MAG: neutral zinc metallopeptidase [Sphingomonadaceae bacterium]
MRLDDQRESRNIENRRGQRPMGSGMGGGGMGLIGAFLPFILSKFGIGGLLVLGAIFLAFQFLGAPGGQMVAPQQTSPAAPGAGTPAKVRSADQFVSKVLATTEDTWGQIFAERGARYPEPILVFFEGAVASACGNASSASGPFYCPADRRVYLDTAFFDQLARQFGAPGEFAAAYVIAHEVGHHVQNVTGVLGQVQQIQQRSRSKAEQNQLQVRVELQADCYAGVWASRNRALLDEGEFEQGVRAAQAIGDDTLMRAAGRRVVPDAFTHGTAEQRVRWLTTGFRAGNPDACDTFSLPYGQL